MTSSPHYPKSNGLVGRNLQTMKRLLKKTGESKQDAFLALLEFPNSPISDMEVFPAELLIGGKLPTRLPTFKSLLEAKTRPMSPVHQRGLTVQVKEYTASHGLRLKK